MDLFLTNTQLFASRHPFTAEDPLVSKWCSATFLQIWWRNKLIYILDGLRMSTFLANVHFWVNYSFLSVWRSHLNKYKSQNVMFWKITQCFKWTLRKYNFGSENSSCSIWDSADTDTWSHEYHSHIYKCLRNDISVYIIFKRFITIHMLCSPQKWLWRAVVFDVMAVVVCSSAQVLSRT